MDKERIYVKLDEIEQYLKEIDEIMPKSIGTYLNNLEKKRALERLLQITIEAVMDTSALLVKELHMGLPAAEEDFLEKLKGKVLEPELVDKLKKMRGFRNILVHGYSKIDDEKVFKILNQDLKDIQDFKKDLIEFLKDK
jgi:Uncharacterized conserved protein